MPEKKEKLENYVEAMQVECNELQLENKKLIDVLIQRMKFDTEQLLPSLLDRIEKLSKPVEIRQFKDGE